MQLQVKLKGVSAASTLSGRIRRQLTKLEQRHHEVEGCRVTIERVPAVATGAEQFVVSLDVGIERKRIRVDGAPHTDIALALRDTFELAHERLTEAGRHASVREASVDAAPVTEEALADRG